MVSNSFAQHTITGRVLDEDAAPLPYAQVVLLNPADSTLMYFDVADDSGSFEIKNIKAGDYLLQITFVTKQTIIEPLTIPAESDTLGDKILRAKPMQEVTVTAEYVPIAIKEDTLEFNAKAFDTKPDAVVEDLLKKIPGIEVDQAGNVKAMGEDVQNVLVDGKEFFGKDTKVATKNLSAKAVDKVQVYDRKSEEAQFTGIDDGVRERTIDLLLNEDHKQGYFGRVQAGGGSGNETHYKTDGKVYRFSSTLQSAVLGNVNNINEFGYAREDQKEWGKQVEGLNRTGAGGLNVSYNIDRANRYFASYLGSLTNSETQRLTSSTNYLQKGDYDQIQDVDEHARSMPHKVNFGVRRNLAGRHNITVDGDIRFKSDEVETQRFEKTAIEEKLINTLEQLTRTTSEAVNSQTKASYIAKLNGGKTQLKTDLFFTYDKSTYGLNWNDWLTVADSGAVIGSRQSQDNTTDRTVFSATPTLIQKLGPLWVLETGLNLATAVENISRHQVTHFMDSGVTNPSTPDFGTRDRLLRPALTLKRMSGRHQYNFTVSGSWHQFSKNRQNASADDESYFYVLPAFSYENYFKKGRRINLRYAARVNMPSVEQLYPVTNDVNRLALFQGNVNLAPEITHNASFSYWMFDYFSFTSLFAHLNLSTTRNKISWSQTINEDLVKLTTPVNTREFYAASSFITFSTPIRPLGINIRLSSHENWSQGLTMINGAENLQTNLTHSLDVSFENRKKEMWDVRLGGRLSRTDARFSASDNNAIYFSSDYYTSLRCTPTARWNIEFEANVVNHDAAAFDEMIRIPLLNTRIDYYIKGERLSIALWAKDLLNQNIGLRRISAANYLMQQEWNTIGRHVMMLLSWKIGG